MKAGLQGEAKIAVTSILWAAGKNTRTLSRLRPMRLLVHPGARLCAAARRGIMPAGLRVYPNARRPMPPADSAFDAILIPGGRPYELAFEAVPADGISPEALAERIAGEQASLKRVEQLAERLTTMAALHEWLFTEHAAYAAHLEPRRETGPKLDTY